MVLTFCLQAKTRRDPVRGDLPESQLTGMREGKSYLLLIRQRLRSFRRLRLVVCGFFTRPTAPRHAPKISCIPSNPESAPNSEVNHLHLE